MYLYFDRYGTLKEQITFNPARVGNSNVNKIFVYWEGVEEFPDWAQELALQTRYLLQDNTQYPSATTFGFSAQPETAELPFDKNQDLKYFKYYKEYKFLTIDIPDEVLSYNGAVKSYIWVLNADKKHILGLGVFAFMVDGDINEVIPDENISLAQWNMISAQLGLLSGSVIDVTCDIATNTLKVYYANGLTAVRNLPPNGAQTTISSDFLREMIFSADTWVQDGENGYYIYFRAETVGYTDNRFFVQLEKDGNYNSDYYNKTGSFVLSDNIFKGSDGSVLLYSNEPYSGRLLVVGGKLLSGDSLVTGLTYNDVNSQLSYKTADGITHTIYLGIEQKFDKSDITQTTGDSTLKVMSQKAVTDNISEIKENLVEISEVVIGRSNYIRNKKLLIDGTITAANGLNTSDAIDVTDYTIVTFRVSELEYSEALYFIEYDANNTKLDHWAASQSRRVTLNANTKYVKFTFVDGYAGKLYDSANNEEIIYEASKYPNLDEIVESLEVNVSTIKSNIDTLFGFAPNLLCDFCYPRDTNFDIYTKSLVLNGNEQGFGDYSVQRVGDKFTIKNSDVGRKKYSHFVFNSDMSASDSKEFEIYYKYYNANQKKLLVIGDSTIAGGQIVTAMRDAYGSNMTLIGTKGTGIYQHCGIGGWRATDFYEKPYRGTDQSDTNPFYNPSTEHFDLSYYLTQNNLEIPTHIILQLGINDVTASLKPDYTMQNINSYVNSMQGIVNNIKSYNSSIEIYVNLIIPPSTKMEHYDAYKAGYLSPQIAMWNDAMAIVAIKKNLKNISGFLPINAVIDRDNDLSDRVHPNNDGYSKIGVFLANCMASI